MHRKTSLVLSLAAIFAFGCDSDGDGVANGDDCAPDNADISPDVEEICDGIDNNCDGVVDEGVTSTFYADADGDGFGGTLTVDACEAPTGFLDNSDDCDDLNADANPDAGEVCDDVDNDCDGLIDGDDDSVDASTGSTFYADGDSDGYGDASVSTESCSTPTGYVDNADDCDDASSSINPETVWYGDQDGDGYGSDVYTTVSCEPVDGYAVEGGDCDDFDAAFNPGAEEACNGWDDNCDGAVPEDETDDDADGYVECEGWVGDEGIWSGDCDDTNDTIYLGATETCDGVDNDCDTVIDLTWNVPADFSDIQSAIDGSADGDGICVDAGTYYENIYTDGKSITIAGAGSDQTIIDGSSSDAVLDMSGGETVELQGMTLTNGAGYYGGAIYADYSSLILNDVIISNSAAGSSYGGAVSLYQGGTLEMDGVEFDSISISGYSMYGGIIDCTGVDSVWANDISVHDSTLSTSGTAYGGIIYHSSSTTVDYSNVEIYDNSFSASTLYGGLFYYGSGSFTGIDVHDNDWYASSTMYSGFYYSSGTISDTSIWSNTYENGSTFYPLFRASSALALDHVEVIGNEVVAGASFYGLFFYQSAATFDATNIIFAGNLVDGGYSTSYGLVGRVASASATFTNADFSGNSLYDLGGTDWGLLTGSSSSSTSITNVNIVGNTRESYLEPLATYFAATSSTASFDANYVNAYANDEGSYAVYDYYGEADMSGALGIIGADPLYTDMVDADPANWDLSLGTGSPSIDAGSPDILDTDGTTSDIGAYGGPGGSW